MRTCDRNSIKSCLGIGGELIPSEHHKRVGWDGARRHRSHSVFLGPHSTGIDVNEAVPADRSGVGSNPEQVVWPMCSSSSITCKYFISGSCVLPSHFIFTKCSLHRMLRPAFPAQAGPTGTCCCCSLACWACTSPSHPAADGHCCTGRAPGHSVLIPS